MSDSNNEVERYDWKSAWKLDDPEWVKERKKKWSEIKNHEIMYIFDRDDKKCVQNYFLTGSAYPEGSLDSPIFDEYEKPVQVDASLLIQVWFHPEVDLKAFEIFKDNTSQSYIIQSKTKYIECLHRYYPAQGGIFGDRDSVIYRAIGLCGGKQEDLGRAYSLEKYYQRCFYAVYELTPPILNFLTHDYSELNVAPELIPEWADVVPHGLKLACKKGGSSRASTISCFVSLVKPSIKIITSPDQYHSKQLEVAQEIISHLKTLDYPDKTKRLTDLLAKV